MLRNFFLVALRNLRKNHIYSFVNIAGLTIGIVCSVLILLWVNDETTYDNFIPKADRLNQVWINAEFDGKLNSWKSVPLPSYEALKDADAHIVNTVVTDWGYDHLVTVGDTRLRQRGFYVSEEFLDMFEFTLVKGDPSTALDEPNSIVISETLAKSLFGEEDPINKVIRLDNEGDLAVSGVLKDVPQNSSFQFELLIPWSYREKTNEWVRDNMDNWGNNSFQVFLELDDPANRRTTESNVSNLIMEHVDEEEFDRQLFLYPMPRWRLYSSFENGVESGGLIEYVRLFTVIAVFILAIACINFMNLSTARSQNRAKEVGIRKSVGSGRKQLILQFLGESLVITFIAFILAMILVVILLPSFNTMVEKELILDYTNSKFWLAALGLILITGIVAGSYPAFYLSGFNPVRTLKGTINVGRKGSLPRKVLVVLQFAVAIILITGTFVIFQQIDLVRNRQLGYDQTKLITIDYTEELRENYETFKTEILRTGAVESMTRSNSSITSVNSNNFLGWPGKPDDLEVIFSTITAEYDYANTMGIDIIEGRDFSIDFKSDTAAIVINKAALELMGLENPIGTQLDLWGEKRTLIGVLDDVLMESVYQDVKPLFIILDDWGGVITLRLNRDQDIQASLNEVEKVYTQFNPAYPFDYSFVDEEYEQKFTYIKLTHRLAIIFASLAMVITGLGLFGLASFMAEQRTKEIGIRKVLGASVTNLVGLMSKDFTWLVLVSFALSAPLAWYLLDQYLDQYEIRTALHWWIFPLAGLIAILFALLIVSN
ncbi:MAG: ABC transporter permease, partial [Cyclobacteriaceae bacterium]